jgi:hypothetical protein
MQTMANKLCDIYEYSAYKRLSDSLRNLEHNILSYQDILRTQVHKKELNSYAQSGQVKMDHFNKTWKEKFADLESKLLLKMSTLEER